MNQYIEEMQNKFPELDFSKFVYTKSKDKSIIICPIHGEFEESHFNIMNYKYGCPKCGYLKAIATKRINYLFKIHENIKKYKNIVFDIEDKRYLNVSREEKIPFICKEHGEFIYNLRMMELTKINPCKMCRGVKTPEERIKDLNEKFPELDFSEFVYEAYSKPSKVICPKHGEFFNNFDKMISKSVKYGCPKCSREEARKTKTKSENLELVKQKYPQYDFSKFVYTKKKTPSTIICSIHGEFMSDCDRLLRNDVYIGCPQCKADMYVSRAEEEIREFIESIYNGKKEYNSRNVISPYELDFYLPEINLAFEYNGIYWHSDKVIKRTGKFNSAKEYHKFKNNECSKLGIDLFHIKEEDYKNNKEQVLEFIKNKINSRI